MLRISKLADYGTMVMVKIAAAPFRLHTAAEVAEESRIPLPTVAKLLKGLTRKGLVASRRGALGGYRLARPPEEITIAHVITALEGPVTVTACSDGEGLCDHEATCATRAPWMRVNEIVQAALEGVTLADMVAASPLHGSTHPLELHPVAASRTQRRQR
ncbi:MAG: SUF system Fe-S cluster assembly regulator [Nitrospirae bacterium CG18_big_fil_WC_8_21_14_2_50_70_55]|nr:SUF system Fe-S cluster assembly regulator [Deltaproteobacteria bacterium]OIP66758.1 MAG: SUF system Fe-S cluster assembly regulator [Nitrospirae bacterium CG2_30_70_394]PIQ06376.1 MAG: SUF system Fe-S cluster assembly regulator [Nitrospirae bacterium CG18_big_fil_WC_8_21_14_2_50_70_55]PIU77332.1 MAG: SUF system Fe-S cluster assembly regulator [Nitrospirae bacterium CG06_land_8_20_14_3_00_70_43]PIW83888.1 MAG: SUF system Fe-S cluster assembly regulator [Nitrospirae bacterium CG_4_8_14_3_um_f